MMPFRKFHEPTGKMTQLSRKIVGVKVRGMIMDRVAVFRRIFRLILDRILACSTRIPKNSIFSSNARYRKLFPINTTRTSTTFSSPSTESNSSNTASFSTGGYESDSDFVPLKISTLGDCRIGKTTFLLKYVGDGGGNRRLEMKGLNVMDKSLCVEGATIGFRIWDVGGDNSSSDQLPIACKDAAAIFFMFDLTSRCTLNSIIGWYNEARKWNQTAVPILIGTKFDDFVRLPHDIQWSVITQARTYARAMKATLFFSSATHNINVNKIFKYIMANLFNLPWTVERNLTIGEPIIDF